MVDNQETTPVESSANGADSKSAKKGPQKILGPDDRPLFVWFALFVVLSGGLNYLVLLLARERPWIATKGLFFGIELTLVLAGLAFLWVVGWLATYCAYTKWLRKALLARHRLYLLAGNFRSGSGFLDIAVPGVACSVAAIAILGTACRGIECPVFTTITVHILVLVCSLAISVWLLHLADYSRITAYLSGIQAQGLGKTIEWLDGTLKMRLEERERFIKATYPGITRVDDLPDREMTTELLHGLLGRLKTQASELESDEDFQALRDRYGNIVTLFHPDYLPHMAHVYLKISQLRALNMAPRRIQLLGRRWTVRGLESEYVVVHDISELRPEYVEWPEMAARIEKVGGLLTNRKTDANQVNPQAQGAAVAEYGKLLEGSEDEVRETKWRQRSLKKRATVTVAPDGSLLGISIEEERQFNI